MRRSEISTTSEMRATLVAPPLAMNSVWRTIRGYVLWQYERGTLHYDIMVTLILLFLFFSPYWINFNDKPVVRNPHPTDVVVTPDGQGHLVYQIQAGIIAPGDDSLVREQLLRVIGPISGEVRIVSYAALTDSRGRVQSYRVVVQR